MATDSNLWKQIWTCGHVFELICGHKFETVATDSTLRPHIRICGNIIYFNLWERLQSVATYSINLWCLLDVGVTTPGLEGQDLEHLILTFETREAYTTEPYYN